jgi:hypothetical protein
MFKVELYGWVRRAVLVDGMSQRTAAREFGISRKSVWKMVAFSVPPRYRREHPVKRPKLDAWVGVIDAILDDDKQRPAKQRHTAKSVWERLREEHPFTGGYTIVKDYLRSAAQRSREMFILLKHGGREYVQVLRLLETFSLVELTHAIEDAPELGTIGFDAAKQLLLCRIEQRPPRLDMENYPHLPLAQVRATQAADYMTLLGTPPNTGVAA